MVHNQNDEQVNRPRNLIVLDATTPVDFSFDQYGKPFVLRITQTADERTWPGGALWDCGWCMAQLLVRNSCTTVTETVSSKKKLPRRTSTQRSIPKSIHLPFTANTIQTVLELGCGVGLTGLVAAAILKPKLTVLTDLEVVIESVTQRNLEQNATLDKKTKTYKIQGCPVRAIPLCWGNNEDESNVRNVIGEKAPDLVRRMFREVILCSATTSWSRSLSEMLHINTSRGLPRTLISSTLPYRTWPGRTQSSCLDYACGYPLVEIYWICFLKLWSPCSHPFLGRNWSLLWRK